jgi:hypothetical protein
MDTETLLVYVTAAFAFFQGVQYLRSAISASSPSENIPQRVAATTGQTRIERADDNRERVSLPARYAVSAIGFGMAGAVLIHLVTPAVAYAILCLSLAARCAADQIVEERTPRRRSALVGRSRSIDPVLITWIALTAASGFALIPWLVEDAYRIAAIVVATCVLIMVAVVWRVASAPPLLFGYDLAAEEIVDRETRALRTGNACALTIGAVMLFVAFVGGQQGYINHEFEVWGLQFLFFALFAWSRLYARHVTRTPLT